MRPRSLSATSLQVARGCLARWEAEYLHRGGGAGDKKAANVGTAVHFALECFVRAVYMEKTTEWSDIKALEVFYMKGYQQAFNHADFNTPEFTDGWTLCKLWHKRTDLSTILEIVSVEEYRTFQIPTSIGEIPFNYIMDRFDILELWSDGEHAGKPRVVRVVDYKTIQAPLNPEDLRDKIQAKAYAVMARIQYPSVERVWVQFDLLRHDPVATAFTYEDNVNAWTEILNEAERIIQTPDDKVPETLNMDCRYCVRAPVCATLQSHVEVGGILGLTIEQIARKKYEIELKLKGLAAFVDQCDNALLREASERGEIEFEVGDLEIEIYRSRRRDIQDASLIAQILGPELAAAHSKFGVTDLDQLMKSGILTDEQIAQIKQHIFTKRGDPKAKVKEKKK